jgi:hypothetical protein
VFSTMIAELKRAVDFARINAYCFVCAKT